MGLLFLVWGDANGKFTYVPKYKPEISKLDYTNCRLSNPIEFPVFFSPVQVDGIDRPFSRTFCSRVGIDDDFSTKTLHES